MSIFAGSIFAKAGHHSPRGPFAVGGEAFVRSGSASIPSGKTLRIGLVNNMPDAALVRTEEQFTALLQSAAGDVAICTRLYALPSVPRGERGRQHLAARYASLEDLCRDPPDAIVVTGAEPKTIDLRDECYWSAFAALIDWADSHGIPAMFSCLAAHAAVLQIDGVERVPFGEKCFGVFDHEVASEHPLMEGVGARISLPHSRWNAVTQASLLDAGYDILCRSDDVGVGIFAKERRAPWLFCQGHPEYDDANLFREYRRDVLRFLRGERMTYPDLPSGCFGAEETQQLVAFRRLALARPNESVMDVFPSAPCGSRRETWRPAAVRIVRHWLDRVVATAWRHRFQTADLPE